MTKRPRIDDQDRQEFRNAVGKVRRIRNQQVELNTPLPKPRLRKIPRHERDAATVKPDLLSDQFHPQEIAAEESLLFLRAGIQHTLARKLRKGQFPIEADLDLHGMITSIARMSVSRFLDQAQDHHARCVLIIHGKGYRSQDSGPVLKVKLNNWLQQRHDVMAFCSAQPQHGGNGAVYVLLKRDKKHR